MNNIVDTFDRLEQEKRNRIEQLKHNEEPLFNTLTYFSEFMVKNGIGYYDEIEMCKEIGFTDDFTDEDIEYFGLRDYELEREINYFNGVETDEN